MRLAYFSPLPPLHTGIAGYSEHLLQHLARYAEIDLYVEEGWPVSPSLANRFAVHRVDEFRAKRGCYDTCLYQMGNAVKYHAGIYGTLCRYPGVTTLHDLHLHAFIAGVTAGRGDPSRYVREMGYAYGGSGLRMARQARQGIHKFDPHDFPLFERVADLSLGVIVHSDYARARVQSAAPNARVRQICQPVPLPPSADRAAARARLGLEADSLMIAAFGFVAETKQTGLALKAFRRLRERFPQAKLVLVGQVVAGFDLASALRDTGLEDGVKHTGYVSEAEFQAYLDASDLVLNLRYPTHGETSATLLQTMASGRPTIITNVDAFAEMPSDACLKVNIGAGEENAVLSAMGQLAEDPALREALGLRARSWVEHNCDPERVAQAYASFVEEVLAVAA